MFSAGATCLELYSLKILNITHSCPSKGVWQQESTLYLNLLLLKRGLKCGCIWTDEGGNV